MSDAWPCRLAPDLWFATDRAQLGQAVHMCVRHCPRLKECADTEARPVDGVLAGLFYNSRGQVGVRQPAESRCGGCIAAMPPNRFNAPRPEPGESCGTWSGVKRHRKLRERPCHPCATFYNTRRRERAAA